MRTYEVVMVNESKNLKGTLHVFGYSCSDAGAEAREKLGKFGYSKIESITCIA